LGALGALLGALGPLLERHAKIMQKSMPKMIDLDPPKPSKMTPKSLPKLTKNRCKNDAKKEPMQDHCRTPQNAKVMETPMQYQQPTKPHKSHVDGFWAPKTNPHGTPKRPENDQTRNTKQEQKK